MEGTALKSTSEWFEGGNGTDDFGFSALPVGNRDLSGLFYDAGYFGWWSSSPSGGNAWYRVLATNVPDIYRYEAIHVTLSGGRMPNERSEGGLTPCGGFRPQLRR